MERRFLRPLSLDYLWDMQPEHRRRLGPLGLRTFGQLAAVPQRLLIGQFGPVGRWYRLLAAGIDARRVKPWSPHPTVSSRLLVEEDDADLPLLEGYLDLLARRVSDTLIATGQYTRVISLTLAMDGACPFASRHLKAPTNLPGPIYQAARGLLVGLLEQIVNRAIGDCRSADGSPHVGRLRRLGHADYRPHSGKPSSLGQLRGTLGGVPSTQSLTLIAGSLETRGLLQLSLFGDPDRGPALRAAIACIQERFGEQAVMTGIGWRVNGAPDR